MKTLTRVLSGLAVVVGGLTFLAGSDFLGIGLLLAGIAGFILTA